MGEVVVVDEWLGEKWYGGGGCYHGDDELHVLRISLVADYVAVLEHGEKLEEMIEAMVARTSFVYEHQFHVKVEIRDLTIHESVSNAPSYATGDCQGFEGKKGQCPGMDSLLYLFTAGPRPLGGAVILLT